MNDNDLYTSVYRDRYYTNGLFLNIRMLSKNNSNNTKTKKIHSLSLGHMMYTPKKTTIAIASLHDRPFAGYLFTRYKQDRYYKNQHIFTFDVEVGIIGEAARAKELQDFIHSIYDYPKVEGWKHQIKNAFGLNASASFLNYFSKISNSTLDISSLSSLKAGTIFTGISTGFYSRFGLKKLQHFSNSIAFNAALSNSEAKKSESFFFLKPMLHYTLYDATIQGSFLNTGSTVTYELAPIYFSFELGYMYTSGKRFNYGYTYHFHTKKLKSTNVTNTNSYGSIFIGYNFN
ncbi:MAG: lipid A deacylase LpxR family protein [Flavobacteriaceae bacterium]|nr:lipid A deacylase LpxR family protein [Flavobacteriaceae bacterium]